ncbi:hypothetical protein [Micromonospora polyrhachis]|uniref:Uncharacterized protein n=1 Tax=Micromonospora polyrhachis TaxID=1282883 RepID=A0A7W7SSB1_9ACTN|nr:hypothetical protein [Micromonospora polyrhachis]MBB4960014.1 hypothetical protein [Micromonospora polyrhachis]
MRTIRIVASAMLACLVLSACAQDGPTGTSPTPTASEGTPVTTPPVDPGSTDSGNPSPPPGKSPVPRPPGRTTPPSDTITISGTIIAGVEAGCVLLDRYLLLGGPRELLRAGATVTVTGRVQPGLMTTCQQGTPFVVESAKAA